MKTYVLSISTSERVQTTLDFFAKWQWDTVRYNNDGLFPSWGRNAILEQFYDSGDEWCCIVDDDCTLFEDRNEVDYFLQQPTTVLNSLPSYVSCVWPLFGTIHAYNRIQQHPKIKSNWSFCRDWQGGKMIFVRNTGKRRFQRTDLDYAEDHEFMYQQLEDGLWTGRCENLIIRERGASQLFDDSKQRVTANNTTTQTMLDAHPLLYTKKGILQRDRLMQAAYPERNIYIPFTHIETHFNRLFEF